LCTTTWLPGAPDWCGCIAMPSDATLKMMLFRMIESETTLELTSQAVSC